MKVVSIELVQLPDARWSLCFVVDGVRVGSGVTGTTPEDTLHALSLRLLSSLF